MRALVIVAALLAAGCLDPPGDPPELVTGPDAPETPPDDGPTSDPGPPADAPEEPADVPDAPPVDAADVADVPPPLDTSPPDAPDPGPDSPEADTGPQCDTDPDCVPPLCQLGACVSGTCQLTKVAGAPCACGIGAVCACAFGAGDSFSCTGASSLVDPLSTTSATFSFDAAPLLEPGDRLAQVLPDPGGGLLAVVERAGEGAVILSGSAPNLAAADTGANYAAAFGGPPASPHLVLADGQWLLFGTGASDPGCKPVRMAVAPAPGGFASSAVALECTSGGAADDAIEQVTVVPLSGGTAAAWAIGRTGEAPTVVWAETAKLGVTAFGALEPAPGPVLPTPAAPGAHVWGDVSAMLDCRAATAGCRLLLVARDGPSAPAGLTKTLISGSSKRTALGISVDFPTLTVWILAEDGTSVSTAEGTW